MRREVVSASQANLRKLLSSVRRWQAKGMTPARAPLGLHVLIIEDQHDIAANIWDFLERRGYSVDHAPDGERGLAAAMAGNIDVIVLDLGLPKLDGLELCQRLRAAGHGVPILMLTARDTLDDKLRGFDAGADDYLVKPFAMRELEARIASLIRRVRPRLDAPLRIGSLTYDPRSMIATRGDRQCMLTLAQSQILVALMTQSPAVVSHEKLRRIVWADGSGDRAALQTHMHALRSQIDRGFDTALIQTIRSVGYRLAAPP